MHVVEETINDMIREHVKAHGVAISRKGVKIKGTALVPDFHLSNGESYLGVGEWESSKAEGAARAQMWHDDASASGSFLLLHSTALQKEIKAREATHDVTEVELEEIVQKESFTIFFKSRGVPVPEKVSVFFTDLPGYFAKRLENSAIKSMDIEVMIGEIEYIEARLRELLPPVNKETARLFRSILGFTDDVKQLAIENDGVAKDAAAYLLIEQLIFYDILSRSHPERYPVMVPGAISTRADIEWYFRSVSNANYLPGFATDILAYISAGNIEAIKRLIGALMFLAPGAINKELLGRLFHKLIPLAFRREVAAFYTMTSSAELLAHLAIDDYDRRIIDPACGSGALLVASYQRMRALYEQSHGAITDGKFEELMRDHITGTDIMPFSAHLARINLAIQRLGDGPPPARIALLDSTRLEKHEEVAGMKPASPFTIDGIDLVIMNPPFTRQELINNLSGTKHNSAALDEYKNLALANILSGTGARYDGLLNKKQAFSSYFMVLADKLLDEGGCIAAVLPATILRTEFNHGLRTFLVAHYSLRYIISRIDALNFSDDTTLKEILFILQKGKPALDHAVTYITVDGLSDGLADGIRLKASTMAPDKKFHRFKGFSIQKRFQRDIDAANLFGPISLGSTALQDLWDGVEASSLLRPLSSFQVNVPRSGRPIITREGAASRGFAKLPHMAIVRVPENKALFTFTGIGDDIIHFRSDRHAYSIDKGDTFNYVRNARNRTLSLDALNEFVIWAISGNKLFDEIDNCGIIKIKRAIEALAAAKKPIKAGKKYTFEEIEAGFEEFCDKLAGMSDKTITSIFNKVIAGHGFEEFQDTWRNYLSDKLCYLGTVDALHVEAPNTYFFAFFAGKEQRVFSSIFLNVPCLTKDQARINALWLNSAVNLVQLFRERNPTGWFKVKQYILEGLKIIDIAKIDKESMDLLNATFNEISSAPFPCMWQQFFVNIPDQLLDDRLKKDVMAAFQLDDIGLASIRAFRCPGRKALDRAIMRVFFPSKTNEQREDDIHLIYRDLLKEIIVEKRNITRYKPGYANGEGEDGEADDSDGIIDVARDDA